MRDGGSFVDARVEPEEVIRQGWGLWRCKGILLRWKKRGWGGTNVCGCHKFFVERRTRLMGMKASRKRRYVDGGNGLGHGMSPVLMGLGPGHPSPPLDEE